MAFRNHHSRFDDSRQRSRIAKNGGPCNQGNGRPANKRCRHAMEFNHCIDANGSRSRGGSLEHAHHAGPMFGLGFWPRLSRTDDARLRSARAGRVPRRPAFTAAVAVAAVCVCARTPSSTAASAAGRDAASAVLTAHSRGVILHAVGWSNAGPGVEWGGRNPAAAGTHFTFRCAANFSADAAVVGFW